MLTVADLVAGLSGGRIPPADLPAAGAIEIANVVIDSRLAGPGSLFIALRGEHQDGSAFVPEALARGAVAVMAEKLPEACACTVVDATDLRSGCAPFAAPVCLLVLDALLALQQVAGYWRRQHDVRVVGVTGSIGKTTTKELVAAVLSNQFETLKSEGNYNNEIGLPLALLHLGPGHQRAVLEMGMYGVGEIRRLAEIALPHVGIVTNVGPVHLERLQTIEHIAQAKAELPQALPAADDGGVAILNADDPRVMAMASLTRARVLTYGLTPAADIWADEIESEGLRGLRFRMHRGGETVHVHVPLLGRHSVHSALSAAAAGLMEGLPWSSVVSGLRDQKAQLRLVAVAGQGGTTIVDDSYNSSPASCIAALNLLSELDGRKMAVLGDMLELGSYELEGHRLVGQRARDVADLLITVGRLGRIIGEEARRAGAADRAIHIAETNAEAIALVQRLRQPGDTILIKGSRGMRMDEIVSALTYSAAAHGLGAKEA